MDKKQLLSNLGIDTIKFPKSGKALCPKCSHTRKNKNDECLSINYEDGTYNCHNNCGFSGKVKEKKINDKVYVRPEFKNTTELADKTVNWFFKRGITQITLNEAKVTESMVYMPQVQKEVKTINFNYFRGGELINVKYRDAEKHFRMIKDAELIFYGVDDIVHSDWCIIVEGEIDRLSFLQAGIKQVVSVPNGASKSASPNLEYLDNCIDYFDNKDKIIIATDGDEAGLALRDELSRRLGQDRCFKVDFKDCKDANDYLVKYGTEELKKVVQDENLIEYPISGIITAGMIWEDVEYLFEHGLKRGDVTGKIKDFDKLVSFVQGQLMVLTGIPNHGKSPFALMIMACLSMNYGWKWGLFTPEHKPLKIYLAKICELLLGKRMREGVGFTVREKELAKEFLDNHFMFIEPEDEDLTLDNILNKAKILVVKRGIKGLLIDPWNKLEHNITKGDNETTYISKELDKVIRFDQKNMVFSIIIAHPVKIRKDPKSGIFEVPNLYDISGSSNWFNKPDIGITFYRNYITKMSEVHVQKIKYEHLGEQGMCELNFNMNNSRFSDKNGTWDNSNWLLPKEEQTNLFVEIKPTVHREPLSNPKIQEPERFEQLAEEGDPF